MNTFSQQLIAALSARNAEVYSNDTVLALNNARRSAVALDVVMSSPEFAEVAPVLVRKARAAKPDDKVNYIAVKVLVKVISTIQALATVRKAELDPYTECIGHNLVKLNCMTNKSNLVCLSKSVEYDALDMTQALSRTRNCSVGTASTQSSSTRMCLHYLGIAEVRKAQQGDVMKLCDNARAQRFVSLYGAQSTSSEPETVSDPASTDSEAPESEAPETVSPDLPETTPEQLIGDLITEHAAEFAAAEVSEDDRVSSDADPVPDEHIGQPDAVKPSNKGKRNGRKGK